MRAKSDLLRHRRLVSGRVVRDASFSARSLRPPLLSRVALLWGPMTLVAMSLPACRRKLEDGKGEEMRAERVGAKAQGEESLAGLKNLIGAQRKALSEMHRRLDA